MKEKLFGTDGVRGVFGVDLTTDLATKLATAFGIFTKGKIENPQIMIATDTRVSKGQLTEAVCKGLMSVGIAPKVAHILPTPAVHVLIKRGYADFGVMITASHNPSEYNGLKFINHSGDYTTDEEEEEIEDIFYNLSTYPKTETTEKPQFVDYEQAFIDIEKNGILQKLDGTKICLDCANGATYHVARQLFELTGATVETIFTESDGTNINRDCGSTHLENLVKYMKENPDTKIGFAFDGDGDRMLAVYQGGRILEGDEMMFLDAYYYHKKGILKHDTIATNLVTNMGIDLSLKKLGINVERVNIVGGKPLQDIMINKGLNLVAEDNGHISFGDFGTCSDGLMSGITMCNMIADGIDIEETLKLYHPLFQGKLNYKLKYKDSTLCSNPELQEMISHAQQTNENLRVVLRPSGTEPLIRIMVEGENEEICNTIAQELFDKLSQLQQ